MKPLDAEAWPIEEDAWVRSLKGITDDNLPLYLQDIDQRFMWRPLPDDGGYVRLQAMFNTEKQTIPAFF